MKDNHHSQQRTVVCKVILVGPTWGGKCPCRVLVYFLHIICIPCYQFELIWRPIFGFVLHAPFSCANIRRTFSYAHSRILSFTLICLPITFACVDFFPFRTLEGCLRFLLYFILPEVVTKPHTRYGFDIRDWSNYNWIWSCRFCSNHSKMQMPSWRNAN